MPVVLVFDTETTGLQKDAFIIQLSYVVFELDDLTHHNYIKNIFRTSDIGEEACSSVDDIASALSGDFIKVVNHYVKIDIPIPPLITEITGITDQDCQTKGVDIVPVLLEFCQDYLEADYIVAHNLDFDRRMIMQELERNYHSLLPFLKERMIFCIFNDFYNRMNNKIMYCTMREGKEIYAAKNVCPLPQTAPDIDSSLSLRQHHISSLTAPAPVPAPASAPSSSPAPAPAPSSSLTKSNTTRTYIKNPKLIELYECLFPNEIKPRNLHNAIIDTMVCARCFLTLVKSSVLNVPLSL